MSREAAYLLDSHTLLWWWFDPDRLSTAVRDLLTNPAMPVLVSAATVWELSLKHHQGKLPELSGAIADLPGLVQADGFEALPMMEGQIRTDISRRQLHAQHILGRDSQRLNFNWRARLHSI